MLSSRVPLSQSDLITLNEEWLLRYSKLKDAFSKNTPTSDEDERTREGYIHSSRKLCAEAICVRAGKMGTLHWSVLEEKYDVEALQQLLENTRLEMDEDAASDLQINLLESCLMQHQPEKLNDDQVFQNQNEIKKHSINISFDIGEGGDETNANNFFNDYPECIQLGWNSNGNDSETESDNGDDNSQSEENSSRRKRRPLCEQTTSPARLPDPHHDSPNSVNRRSHPVSSFSDAHLISIDNCHRHSTEETSYYDQKRVIHHERTNNRNNNTSNSLYRSEKKISSTKYDHPGWELHSNGQNPFQTAREYAKASVDSSGDEKNDSRTNYRNNNNNNRRQEEVDCNNGRSDDSRKPCNRQLQERGINTSKLRETSIRESLKRKFKPPKRVAVAENCGEQNLRRNRSAKAASPGGVGAKATAPASEGADEDDLPEELRQYGKELVDKIMNEIMGSGDPISFNDIAGLADAKQTVKELVCWPMKRPDLFTGLRRAPNGLLLYGPPGTGKTLIGKAIAHESDSTFFSISSSSLTSKWIGEGEKLVRTLFAVAAFREPAVVFIDEIDSLLTQRKADENEASRRMKTEFLVQIDGFSSGRGRVLVIGATNRPQELDEAARRRFVKRLYIPLPEDADREVLLHVLLKSNNNTLTDENVKKLASQTAGFSGADLKALCSDAAMEPIRELGATINLLEIDVNDVPPISYKHFQQALRGINPSVAPTDLLHYIEWDKKFGSRRSGMVK